MKIGVLGAGQLGQMLALARPSLDLKFVFMDPSSEACAAHLGDMIVGEFTDQKKLALFCDSVDLVTYESENIPASCAEFVAAHRPIYPGLNALITAQDRLVEKNFFSALGIPVAEFLTIDNNEELMKAAEMLGFPFIVKTRRQGYDGKGQFFIKNLQDLDQVKKWYLTNALAEKKVNFQREISIIALRAKNGETRFYDLCENRHENGILRQTQNRPNDPLFNMAKHYAQKMLEKLDYVGILVIEFFDCDGVLIANEMAPRVHNSGHWTIEGAKCSQFENHLRAICGLPLGDTQSLGNFLMTNIIGDFKPYASLLNMPGVFVHDYGKAARPGRKLGHVTQLIGQLRHENPQ